MSEPGFSRIYIVAIAIVLFGVAFFLLLAKGSAALILTASTDKASYSSGDSINLVVRLTNSGTRETCVSDMVLGNIKFLSVTRNGKSVEMRTAPSYYITSLSEMMKAKLKRIAPGESTAVALSSSQDPGLDANAFYSTTPKGTYGMSTFYKVGAAGTYEMKIAYEYPGEPSHDCPDVFKKTIESATVTFTVTK